MRRITKERKVNTTTLVSLVLLAVFVILYVIKRRSRLNHEDIE